MTSKSSKDGKMAPTDIFQCRQCGECCKGYGGTYVTETDVKAISDFIGTTPERFLEDYCQMSGRRPVLAQGEHGFCLFWKDNLCSIHPVKPRMCRAWPYIDAVLKDAQNWFMMAGSCPGMRTDVSPEAIQECVASKLNKKGN